MKTALLCLAVLGSSLSAALAGGVQNSSYPPAAMQIDDLAAVLEQQRQAASGQNRYQAYKGQMWLSYARHEMSEGSLSSAGQEAWQQAQSIAQSLQQHQPLSLVTPVLSVSQVMRRDLWQQIEYFKQQGALERAPEQLAQAEVMLVWAAAEYCELGWRHAREHFQAAERAVYQVAQTSPVQAGAAAPAWHPEQLPALQQLNGQGCAGVNPEFWPLTADPAAAGVRLNNVVHFAFDRADLSRESQKVLDQFIAVFAQHPQMQVTLLGYTDKRATQKYNLELAQRRIQSVQDYLAAQGIEVQRIQSEAKGAADLQADADLRLASAKSRRVVLQLSSSEQIQVILEPQWQDLQIESDQQKAKVN
ncbi:MAG: OmpA family protein [Acinetobacter sp.]